MPGHGYQCHELGGPGAPAAQRGESRTERRKVPEEDPETRPRLMWTRFAGGLHGGASRILYLLHGMRAAASWPAARPGARGKVGIVTGGGSGTCRCHGLCRRGAARCLRNRATSFRLAFGGAIGRRDPRPPTVAAGAVLPALGNYDGDVMNNFDMAGDSGGVRRHHLHDRPPGR